MFAKHNEQVGKRNVKPEMNASLEEFWCADCDASQHGTCKKHGALNKIQDAVIPSRARLTLPPSLCLKTIKEDGKIHQGVYSKRLIPVRSQFGPFDAPVISTSRKESKPKEKRTVWKKKHAMQKSLEQSAMSQSTDSVEQGLSADLQTSPVIASVQPLASPQKQPHSNVLNVSSAPGNAMTGTMHGGDLPMSSLNQNLLSLSSQIMAQPELIDSIQNMQSGLQQMTSPTQGHHQLPLHSSPIISNNQLGHLHLQGGLQDFPPINFQSPTQGNLQVQVMAENLQSLQDHFQNYGHHIDLNPHQPSGSLNGYIPPSSVDNLSVSIPTMHQNQSGSSSGHGMPPTDSESQSAEDSGVGDTSHANMSDSTILDYTSDTDMDESSEQDFSFEIKRKQHYYILPHFSVGSTIEGKNLLQERAMLIQRNKLHVATDDGSLELYDRTDEEHSNWMIFVRPARNVSEQNLVAYQDDGHIFFVSLKPIPPNTELKVWYSNDYAKSIGKSALQVENQSENSGRDAALDCSVCKVSFLNNSDLENHPCLGKVKARRKGRPRKYVKPTKTWRAKLEKTRLKESMQVKKEMAASGPPRTRGRPRIKPIVIKNEKGNLKAEPVKAEAVKAEPAKIQYSKVEVEDFPDDDDSLDRDEPEYIIALETDTEVVKPVVDATVKKKRGPKARREPFNCPHCNQKFVAEANFNIHVYGHTGVKPFICTVPNCGRGFMSKFKMERHGLIHTSPRHHRCPYCDKSFNRKDHLKNHMITHDPNKKVWKCDLCAKEYSYSFSYRTHMAFHAAENGETLECKICKKTFESKEELLFHLKVHTGARPAKNASEKQQPCFECGKKFFTRKDVKRHMITHTKKKDFLCQFCPQRFGRKDHLTRHLRTSHTGDGQTVRVRKSPGDGSTAKKRERQIRYDTLEPTMVPLPLGLASIPDDEQQIFAGTTVVSGSQAALLQNLQYAVSQMPGQSGIREIQIPAALFEAAAAAANSQPAAAASVSNIQAPPGMPSTQTSTQPHYTINEKGHILNSNQADVSMMRQVHPGIDYRTISQAAQGYFPVQIQQEQELQQPTLIASPTKIDPQTAADLNRSNGVLQVAEYQLSSPKAAVVSESPSRASVLMTNADPRQNLPPQTTQSLLGYMETLKFLENLPTNTAPSAIHLQQLQNAVNAQNLVNVQNVQAAGDASQNQQPQLIPVSYASTGSLNQNIININQADLKNLIAVPHSPTQGDLKNLVALSQNVNQSDIKNMVAFSHNPTPAELKNMVALSQAANQTDLKSLIALSQQPINQADLKNIIALSQNQNALQIAQQDVKGMIISHSPGQHIAYQQQQSQS